MIYFVPNADRPRNPSLMHDPEIHRVVTSQSLALRLLIMIRTKSRECLLGLVFQFSVVHIPSHFLALSATALVAYTFRSVSTCVLPLPTRLYPSPRSVVLEAIHTA